MKAATTKTEKRKEMKKTSRDLKRRECCPPRSNTVGERETSLHGAKRDEEKGKREREENEAKARRELKFPL